MTLSEADTARIHRFAGTWSLDLECNGFQSPLGSELIKCNICGTVTNCYGTHSVSMPPITEADRDKIAMACLRKLPNTMDVSTDVYFDLSKSQWCCRVEDPDRVLAYGCNTDPAVAILTATLAYLNALSVEGR